MLGFARFRILLLALMVAVSHVALLAHATAHFHPELGQCELCVGQPQPLAAIPSPDSTPLAAVAAGSAPTATVERLAPSTSFRPYHQRAPPIFLP